MVADVIIRPVELEDAPSLAAHCWRDVPVSTVRSLLYDVIKRRERDLVWGLVAVADKDVIAYGQVTRWGHIGEISDVIVDEAWRGQGVGSTLIRRLLAAAAEQNIREVEIGAQASNEHALILYRRLGFTDKRQVMMEFGKGPEPVIYLARRLDDSAGSNNA